MIRKLFILLCLCAPAWATTTIQGNLKTLGTGSVSLGTFVRFYLRGCAGNQPRVNGTGIIAPTLGNIYYVDFVPNSSGAISGTVYSTTDIAGTGNGDIECGGFRTGLWYGIVPFLNGKAGPETPVAAKNTGTIDISNTTPITANPVILAPTGDTTYLRLDAGNGPLTASLSGPFTVAGAIAANTINNTCYANLASGADLGAKINTCIAAGGTDVVITASGTITTPVVINNKNNIAIRGIATGSAVALINGITGIGAACAITISGTSVHILLQDIEVDGNSLTGASGNGNGICINGTGPTPNTIWLIRASSQFNKGTGLNSSASQIPATGLYMANVVDVYVDMGQYGANQVGIFTDVNTEHAEIRRTGIFQNVLSAWKTSTSDHNLFGPGNDVEGNGTLTSSKYLDVDGCLACNIFGNWFESNSGFISLTSTSQFAQIDFYDNLMFHGANGSTPATTSAITDAANVDLNIHDNYLSMEQNMTGVIVFTPSANASIGKVYSRNIMDFAAGSMNGFGVGWAAGTHAGKCTFDNNSFGSPLNTTFNGSAGNAGIDIGAGTSGCQVRGTACHNGSGALASCVKVESGASLTYIADVQTSGGAVTTPVTDSGSFTTCLGKGCSAGGVLSTNSIQTSSGISLFIRGLNAGGGQTVFGTAGTFIVDDASELKVNTLLESPTSPTIAAGGCGGSAASIVVANGTAAFKVNVGSTPGSACTITMPAATTGWNCYATDITTNSTSVFVQKQTGAESTTSVTITNFSDVAAATAFTGSDILKMSCWAD